MEKKELAFQSFERNQSLQDAINKLLIHLKLEAKEIDSNIDQLEILRARKLILAFLDKLNSLVENQGKVSTPLTGIDLRYRSLVRKYLAAKSKRQQFRSVLFRNSPQQVSNLLKLDDGSANKELISSLTEFRSLLDDHGFNDVRELIGEI